MAKDDIELRGKILGPAMVVEADHNAALKSNIPLLIKAIQNMGVTPELKPPKTGLYQYIPLGVSDVLPPSQVTAPNAKEFDSFFDRNKITIAQIIYPEIGADGLRFINNPSYATVKDSLIKALQKNKKDLVSAGHISLLLGDPTLEKFPFKTAQNMADVRENNEVRPSLGERLKHALGLGSTLSGGTLSGLLNKASEIREDTSIPSASLGGLHETFLKGAEPVVDSEQFKNDERVMAEALKALAGSIKAENPEIAKTTLEISPLSPEDQQKIEDAVKTLLNPTQVVPRRLSAWPKPSDPQI